MSSIVVGDLVCMFRRRKKGMGIVLEATDDIVRSSGLDMSFEQLSEQLSAVKSDKIASRALRRKWRNAATRPELVNTVLVFNAGWAKKPKKEFVRIRWFDRPSVFEAKESYHGEEWCPVDWVRKL